MVVAIAAACSPITTDLDRVIAIEVAGGTSRDVETGGMLQLMAAALDGTGDTVPDAVITWELIDVDSGQVGFTLDPSGLVTAVSPGNGRVQARFETLRAGPITVSVIDVIPDSIAAVGDQRVTQGTADTTSPPLVVVVYDLTLAPPSAIPLDSQTVAFALTLPAPGSAEAQGFFLTVGDTVPVGDPHRLDVLTDDLGLATIVVRRLSPGTVPDSAVIHASLGSVAGSPLEFVVLFEQAPP